MTKHEQTTDSQERRDILAGHAFQIMNARGEPLSLIASVANKTEAEVKRLIAMAKSDAARR